MSAKHRHGHRAEGESEDRFGVDVRPEQRTIQQVMASRRNAAATTARQAYAIYGGKPPEEPAEELTSVRIQHMMENAQAERDEAIGQLGPSRRSGKRHHGHYKFRGQPQ